MRVSAASSATANTRQIGGATGGLLASILVVAIFAALILAVGWPAQVRVDSPRLGTPSIDQSGAMIEVRLASSLPFVLPKMDLSLEGSGGVAPLLETARHWDGTEAVLSVVLPKLPDGAYALRVRTTTQNLVRAKAVFLRSTWPSVLRLVQIADLPPPGREPMMQHFVEIMQRQHPDAVLVSGDINYTGSESNINFINAQLSRLDVPVIMTAGNHEREAWHRYLRVFGARDHRTNFGPLAILSLDSGHGRDALTPSSFRWLQEQMQQLGGRTPIIQMHHPMFPPGATANSEAGGTGGYMHGYRSAFLELCQTYHVPLVLSGHWHSDAVFDQQGHLRTDRSDFPGTKYVVTTALGAEARKVFDQVVQRNGYRWIVFTNGQLVSYSPDPHNPVPSTPMVAQ